jgi:hypothetical protein
MVMRALRWLLALSLVFVACGDEAGPATEIVVYVDADDAVRGRATNIEVVVSGRAADGSEFALAEGGLIDIPPAELPFQFSFAPLDGDASRQWEVIVGAQESDGEMPFVRTIARGVYVPDQSRVLYMVLRNDCADVGCPPTDTCEAGDCTDAIRPPDELPVYEGGRVPPPDMPAPMCTRDEDCDDGLFCNGPESCDPGNPGAGPAGCLAGMPPCPMGDACDETMESCMMGGCEMPDADSDGFDRPECSGGADCNDEESSINPDATEVEDGLDNDCDGAIDEGFDDCVLGPENAAAVCMDGCDNDEDGRTDCEDLECPRGEACFCPDDPTVERSDAACSDGCDNDHNGFTDCADWHCDGYAGCTGANRSCDRCDASEACLARRPYGFTSGGRPTCGSPCDISNDVDAATPGFQPDCPSGQWCWWRGEPGSTDGVCAPGNEGSASARDIGAACSSDVACASPKGWGRCLNDAEEGFTGGYCTILDCAAPGGPPSPGLCGTTGECVRLDNTSYCFRRCTTTTENCESGYECITDVGGGVCLPRCSASDPCGTFGTCIDDRYCLPSIGF